jgi:hypothetical protein
MAAIREGGALPRAGKQGWTDLRDNVKHNIGVIEITRFAIKLSNQDKGAFLRLLEGEMRGIANDIRKDINRQAWGNGTGTLATVTADGASAFTADTLQYVRIGMVIDMVRRDRGEVLGSERTIERINERTRVVTYSGADMAATTEHIICRTGSWENEINGLNNLISERGTVHGVDSTTEANRWWKSPVFEGEGNAFSEDLGQQAIDAVGSSGNAEVELLISTRGIRRRYIGTLKSQKRFNDANSVTLHGGFKAVMFNEFPLVFDDDCPKGTMWFLNPDEMLWVYLPGSEGDSDWGWVDDDGAILQRSLSRTDAFEGYIAADHNLGCLARNTQSKITNLADDAAPIWN